MYDNLRANYNAVLFTLVLNTALFAVKYWAGEVSGSLALTADAWHTLSDTFSSLVLLIAFKLSAQKPDKEHPFGHGRWEQIAALFIAFLLAFIAYDFLRDAYYRLQQHETAHFGIIAIAVTVLSVVVKEGLARYALAVAKRTDNSGLRADAWHHRSDALSSVVVLGGIFLAPYLWWLDSAMAAAIALILLYAAYTIARADIVKLLGQQPAPELEKKIRAAVAAAYPADLQIHHLHLHNYVNHQELTFHIYVDPQMTIAEAHRIATQIENAVENKCGIIATVHVEPLKNHDFDESQRMLRAEDALTKDTLADLDELAP